MSESKRVLVALDASQQNQSLLEAAADLAHRLGADLEGLFVEDVDLINLAGLPFAREHRLRHAVRQLDLATVEQELRERAEAARRALMQAAERRRLSWRFEVKRGQPAVEFLAAAAGAECVALSAMARATLQLGQGGDVTHTVVRSATVALLCSQKLAADPARPILLVYDGSPAARRALEFAVRLAGHDTGLTVLVAAADAEAAMPMQQGLRERLQPSGVEFRLRSLLAAERGNAIEALRREHGSLVLLPVDGELAGGLTPDLVLQRLGLPVLQIRAADERAA